MSASVFCMTETFRKIFFACRPGIHALLCLFPIPFSLPSFSFFIKTFFLKQFKVHSKIDEKAQTFPICLLPHTCAASRIISLPHYSGAFVTMMNLQRHIITCDAHILPHGSLWILLYILWIWTNV